ncbi:MAG: energy-coupling factor transporter ATPase [Clostridia bacterium]|nr:energy-coupling factor transporter ATPase [Clostridia bacterium]
MNRVFLKTSHLSYTYPQENAAETHYAVHDLSLEIERGSFVAVLGHNGSGKSTLAKLLNGILVPTAGQVLVDGIDTADDTRVFDIRKKIGMVFQNPDNQLVSSIVEEDVAFGPENLGIAPDEIRRRVDEALASVGMQDAHQRAPHTLSGGQKQRIAIAGVLAMQPECIVFDESTAMLDPLGREEILNTILHLKNDLGLTVILITHHMNEAAKADRVLVMNEGDLVLEGAPEEVFSEVETLWKIGLDVPQTAELLHLISQNETVKKTGIDTRGVLSEEETVALLKKLLSTVGGDAK